MAQCVFDIKIGVDKSESKELYEAIDIVFEMHQQKLLKFNQQFCTLLSKQPIPLIIIEYPQLNLQDLDIFNFDSELYDSGFSKNNSRLFQYCYPKDKDMIKIIKNVDKQFQKISKLNNSGFIKINLYNCDSEEKVGLQFLNHAKIKANMSLDKQLVGVLSDIMRRISNEFLNSPIMAFLQLLQNLTLKLDCKSINECPQLIQLIKSLNLKSYLNLSNLSRLADLKNEFIFYITIPKLINIKLNIKCKLLRYILLNLY